jgi:hypothetical protein
MKPFRSIRFAAVSLALLLAAQAARTADVEVSTAAGLYAALDAARPGTRIHLVAGHYELDRSLKVPDGVALSGSGSMELDAEGRAAGMVPAGATTLRAHGAWSGNVIEMGHRASLQRLSVVDAPEEAAGPNDEAPLRNLVVVASRRPGDVVEASIRDCELSTGQSFSFGRAGPSGRAIGVWTRNPSDGGPMDAEAEVRLNLERSIVRAPNSNSMFAINFAAGGRVEVTISGSLLHGQLSAAGGASRPDPVTHASTLIRSHNTLYAAADGLGRVGWHLFGGSGVPHPDLGLGVPPGADDNLALFFSRGDRIEGYRTGILAAAGRRIGNLSGPSSGNRLELDLRDLRIRSEGEGAADLRLFGALAEATPGGTETLPPGERNVLTLRLQGGTGSGRRDNRYAHLERPESGVPGDDAGNRLRIEGSAAQFGQSNPGFDPAPAGEYFETGSR